MKIFKMIGLMFFVKARNKGEAVLKCSSYYWGVTESGLVEVSSIPVNAVRVI